MGQGAMAPPLFILTFQGLRSADANFSMGFLVKDILAGYWGCGLSIVGVASGVDPGFSEGGANGKAWRMVAAAGRVPLKLLPCVLNVCN